MEKMKLHSQVRTAECKEKLMLQNMKKKRDELDVLKTSLAQVEDKIKAINENIYSREYKLEKLQEELRTTRDQ
jgi:peptidoglycan hydrolase CwlO-like protein